ncbi:MGDG synthase family glycosyltransferase [Alicyclobacillus sp. ALC3]|uniref:MGDG synthase family glycosyltransferase n=1 Tax=Alicyclobacillus sp. ALC3 TaxID=2796143 RepID=UPI00237884AE|nr:glycosyltransferase [Alicyclobacillus sp. ALC3]WDL95195.1 hypothetical protein JC200_12250 [Alicyclobacillus sp. ALC3]
MAKRVKILILSASYGEGHQQAATAIRDAIGAECPEAEVVIVDYIRAMHPTLDSIAKYCYLQSVRFAPMLYGWFYNGTSQIAPSSLVQRQLNSIGLNGLDELLRREAPDVVLCTFPTPAGVASHLKQLRRTNVPLATVITDHAVHSQWIHPHTDLYFVGSHPVKAGLIKRGVAARAIKVTGIPLRSTFFNSTHHETDRTTVQQHYGLNPALPTLLIMGGGYGMLGEIESIVDNLLNGAGGESPVGGTGLLGRGLASGKPALLSGLLPISGGLPRPSRLLPIPSGLPRPSRPLPIPSGLPRPSQLPPLQILVVTGRNERLRAQLEAMLTDRPMEWQQRVRVFGFIDTIAELMAVSDLMLTKAGGLTVSEGLASQLPMVLYRPIPGQEVQNARFLVRSGAAVLAENQADVVQHVHNLLLWHPALRADMQQQAARVRKLHASREIAREVIALAERRQAENRPGHDLQMGPASAQSKTAWDIG